ncbi:MAG: Fe-S cluster assembly ATPase SufC [Alphaproteobacteria bacterium]|nr:Fe-S cluster assembly ATPase SufC [Alphaproteobacteria bacterium]
MQENKYLLEIKGLRARVKGSDEEILKGVDLCVPSGEVHAIMGPNGSGKSTLSYVLAGHWNYDVISGEIYLDGESLLGSLPDERAAKGLFLAFQYPVEIPGVTTLALLRQSLNMQRKAGGKAELSIPDFKKIVDEKSKKLNVSGAMLRRPVNVGFSGGEKKRNEIMQMAVLEPKLCILDETDSGLDIDALKLVADGVNALRSPDRSMILITHYQRLLDYIVPDKVHILSAGRIVCNGGKDLALDLENHGYSGFIKASV